MENRIWERLPNETDKAYSAFMTYISLPLHGPSKEERRSVRSTAIKLGYKSINILNVWSGKYNWVERARAYDMHVGNKALEVKETSLEQFQQAIVTNTTAQLTVLNNMIMSVLAKYKKKIDVGEDIDSMELLRLANAIEKVDKTLRRAAQMPTGFKQGETDYEVDDEDVFVIEG